MTTKKAKPKIPKCKYCGGHHKSEDCDIAKKADNLRKGEDNVEDLFPFEEIDKPLLFVTG